MSELIINKLITAAEKLITDDNTLPDLTVTVSSLTPVEAIGSPGDWDYPLLRGKEKLVQASIRENLGQAFTGSPTAYTGRLRDILCLDMNKPENRAVFIASLNALLRHQGLIKKTVHCHNDDPEQCGKEIALFIEQKHNPQQIGIAGYQPALVSACIDYFGADRVFVTDLSAGNPGKVIRGVEIWDGISKTADLLDHCDLLLVTGSVFVNNTAEPFYRAYKNGKPLYFFGTSVTGIAHLLGLAHLCPLGS